MLLSVAKNPKEQAGSRNVRPPVNTVGGTMQLNTASSSQSLQAQTETSAHKGPSRIYYVHPLALHGLDQWREIFAHAAELGFDTVLSAPLSQRAQSGSVFVSSDLDAADGLLGLPTDLKQAVSELTSMARAEGLRFMMDIVPDRIAAPFSEAAPVSDPRLSPLTAGGQSISSLAADAQEQHIRRWEDRIGALVESGISGFRCLGLNRLPLSVWNRLTVAGENADFLAWTPGTDFALRQQLADEKFAGCFSSFAWWDLQERWFLEEYALQRTLGAQIAFPEAPYGKRVAHGIDSVEIRLRRARLRLSLAETIGQGLMIPMGFEFGDPVPLDPTYGSGQGLRRLKAASSYDLRSDIRDANQMLEQRKPAPAPYLHLVSTGKSQTLALLQSDQEDLRVSSRVSVMLANTDFRRPAKAPLGAVQEAASGFLPLRDASNSTIEATQLKLLKPAELRILEGHTSQSIKGVLNVADAAEAAQSPRLAIENITPTVDGGRFPIKRIAGETITVEADLFGDGHDPISAALFWRAADEESWTEVPMRLVLNDRWQAEFAPQRMGRHEFAVETWRNPFQIFRYEFGKKHEARLDLKLEIQEGILLVKSARDRAEGSLRQDLEDLAAKLNEGNEQVRTSILLAPDTAELMAKADCRPHRVRSAPMPVEVERKGAAFASWYQIFPRSQSGDPNRHGTFDDVIKRLPAIRDMGFDVLYFPPIHPIGKTNRKGRNNSLIAGPNDPGSPYGIGSEAGGHDAIHPELGTFEDFRRLVEEARRHGLEIALDLAIQASPDHPWLKEHPGWFDWRPDGTVRYAENPPKKYEDIVNVDFYAKDAVPGLWIELRDVVQKWVDQASSCSASITHTQSPFPSGNG